MKPLTESAETVLTLSDNIRILPIRNASSDVAQEVRELFLSQRADCLAVALPPSVEPLVEQGIERLPQIGLVVLPEPDQKEHPTCSYIPIDPCQPTIMALRAAMGEGIARAYIDRDVTVFELLSFPSPDPYALKHISLPTFAGALLPFMLCTVIQADQVSGIRVQMSNPIALRGGVMLVPLTAEAHGDHWPGTIRLTLEDGRNIDGTVRITDAVVNT